MEHFDPARHYWTIDVDKRGFLRTLRDIKTDDAILHFVEASIEVARRRIENQEPGRLNRGFGPNWLEPVFRGGPLLSR